MVVVMLGHVFSSSASPTLTPSAETASIKAYCQNSSALSHASHLMHLGQMSGDCDLREKQFSFQTASLNTIAWKAGQRRGIMQKT